MSAQKNFLGIVAVIVATGGCVPKQQAEPPPAAAPWATIPAAVAGGEGECEPDAQPPMTACDWLSGHALVAVGRIVSVRADYEPLMAVVASDQDQVSVDDASECMNIDPGLEVEVELAEVFRGDARGVIRLNLPAAVVESWSVTPVTTYPDESVQWSDGASYAQVGSRLFFGAFQIGEAHFSSWGSWPHLGADGELRFVDNDCGTLHDASLEAPIEDVMERLRGCGIRDDADALIEEQMRTYGPQQTRRVTAYDGARCALPPPPLPECAIPADCPPDRPQCVDSVCVLASP